MEANGPMHWRNDRDLSGYNILNMGIWYEAMIRWVGPATRVMANTKVNVSQRRDEQGAAIPVSIPDHVDILADLASGAQANLRFSAVTGFSPGNDVWIYGSEGTLRLDSGLNVWGGQRGDSQLTEIPNPTEGQAYWRVEEEFCSAIRGQEKITRTPFDVGLHYMEFTEAVTRSSQNRQVVSLPL
jgi:predicted dehydrogenase